MHQPPVPVLDRRQGFPLPSPTMYFQPVQEPLAAERGGGGFKPSQLWSSTHSPGNTAASARSNGEAAGWGMMSTSPLSKTHELDTSFGNQQHQQQQQQQQQQQPMDDAQNTSFGNDDMSFGPHSNMQSERPLHGCNTSGHNGNSSFQLNSNHRHTQHINTNLRLDSNNSPFVSAPAAGQGTGPASSFQAPLTQIPQGVPLADACAITPALRAWIECLVDSRVEEACQSSMASHIEGHVRHWQECRSEDLDNLDIMKREVDLSIRQLESQLQSLNDAQARLLGVVEGLSNDAERQQSRDLGARSEALLGVERLTGTVEELQRSIDERDERLRRKLQQTEDTVLEIQTHHAEEVAKTRTAIAELQRVQGATAARHRQTSEELTSTTQCIAQTRSEVVELMQVVQRFEQRLGAWKGELRDEVALELQNKSANKEMSGEVDRLRHRLEMLQRETTAASALRSELEIKLEALRLDLSSSLGHRGEQDSRLREGQQHLEQRMEELASVHQRFQAALTDQYNEKTTLEERLREAHQSLTRRLDDLQDAATKDVQRAQQDIEEMTLQVQHQEQGIIQRLEQKLEQRISLLRSEVSNDALSLEELKDESAAMTEELRREMVGRTSDLDGKVERLRAEQAAQSSSREAFEYRWREAQEEWQRTSEQGLASLREEVESLERRTTLEIEARVEACRSDQLAVLKTKSAELKAELKSSMKQEQANLAALDEQLWLTDQRLGQRLDELCHRLALSTAELVSPALPAGRPYPSFQEQPQPRRELLDRSGPRPEFQVSQVSAASASSSLPLREPPGTSLPEGQVGGIVDTSPSAQAVWSKLGSRSLLAEEPVQRVNIEEYTTIKDGDGQGGGYCAYGDSARAGFQSGSAEQIVQVAPEMPPSFQERPRSARGWYSSSALAQLSK